MPVDVFGRAVAAALALSLFIVVGISAQIEPAASLARMAVSGGADLWKVNPEETPLTPYCTQSWRSPTGEVMDQIVEAALATTG